MLAQSGHSRAYVLEVGGVLAFYVCGQDLVAFRGESGEVSVVDAFCRHMGVRATWVRGWLRELLQQRGGVTPSGAALPFL